MSQKPPISLYGDVSKVMGWQHFREFTVGDKELEIEILSIFLKSMPEYLYELANTDESGWAASCHKIKGATRTIGAWSLAQLCQDAEKMTPPIHDSPEKKVIIASFDKEFAKLKTELLDEYGALASSS